MREPEILPPGIEKFTPPARVEFDFLPAGLSALSLLGFAGVSLFAVLSGLSRQHPWWAIAPFIATAVGSIGGFLYEFWLLICRQQFQLLGTSAGRVIQTLRAGNLAFVFGTVYLAYCLLCQSGESEALWFTLVSSTLTGFLLINLMFRGPLLSIAIPLTLGLVAQLVLLYVSSASIESARLPLLGAAIGLYATMLIGSQTPERSTLFHLVAIAVVALLWVGLNRHFAARSGELLPLSAAIVRLIVALPLGALLSFLFIPGTWATLRSAVANWVWPLFYLIIAGGPRIPRPRRLSEVYAGSQNEIKPLRLLPYYVAHPRNLTHPVSIPCLDEALTLKVHSLGFLGQLVRFVFAAASVLGQIFPFASLSTPLARKPRMAPWSDGTEYWPRWLTKTIWLPRLGSFAIQSGVRGPGFQPTPETAIKQYKEGQLLAYLAEYGVAGTFLRPTTFAGGTPGFELDFSFLEYYESKPDYERYGGRAYFVIDGATHSLRLTHLRGPRTDLDIVADPLAPTFRHVEDIVLASLYFYIVSGKHLVEIHMGLNLVEVALFNSFDARLDWAHPVRLALYPHLFAHELAEELTTQNLLEDGAVFSQIFATTGPSLMRHLNDRFSEYQLGVDEDFDRREQVLLAGNPGARLEQVLPNCGLVWEKEYAALWQEYATALVSAAFVNDAAVSADEGLQTLFVQLRALFAQPLPDRYSRLATKAGLARFIADMIHHLVIRHEVYGTTAVRLSLDPRISKVQVPKDGGSYAVDEWRSLACIAMATSRVRYTLFVETEWSSVFDDLKDKNVRKAYQTAYDNLKTRLTNLQKAWENDGRNNYDTLRPLPEELDLGAGY